MSTPEPSGLLALCEPLLAPIASLKGIGPRHAGLLRKVAGGGRIIDLLFTMPDHVIDRRATMPLSEARTRLAPGGILTLDVEILGIERPKRDRQPFRARASDGSDELDIVFFHAYLLRDVHVGDRLAISGKLEHYGLSLSMPHPDFMLPLDRRHEIPALEPVWPLTAGLFPSTMRKAMNAALSRLPVDLPEWLDPALLKAHHWPGFVGALRDVHAPVLTGDAKWEEQFARARARLAFDELLADQLCLGIARARARTREGRKLVGDGSLRREALRRFGHEPTGAQKRAFTEIAADLEAACPMTRLLQGDVGAGKTLVATLAMLQAVEAGTQAALMAPTEILARQHFETLSRLCPVPCVFLSGSIKGRARREALEAISSGAAPIVIGTHALFQDKVVFHDLGLAVIDEQHRFGVEQRMKLGHKGRATDVLVMTATPIPRTLLLTQWGELQVSRLDEKPPGRLPIATSVHALSSLDDIIAGIRRSLARGTQVYWVCPLVEESEALDLAAAEARWADLAERFSEPVGLAHGKQDIVQRQAALDAFRRGETRLLVATTVIEVGVDVPDASIMVIEHAERFGLAQLHQLRGRVGRGSARSFCLLLYDEASGLAARSRLGLLRETEDGFRIADEDFRHRGGGDLAGSRQSGLPGFRLATGFPSDRLIHAAWQESARRLSSDTGLAAAGNASLHVLLHLFDRDTPERILTSG